MSRAKDEIAYLEHRLEATIYQRDNAAADSSRAAHQGLVDLYQRRLAMLQNDGEAALRAELLIASSPETQAIDPRPAGLQQLWQRYRPGAIDRPALLRA